ncbi:bestrophin family protein [Chryseobacterium wangxinyae]|uniref:bestrophin family protein n=1 Tax=Chryseobacterium sp. CY353 TaxID=2997334 RepID=UPI00226F5A3F|nr:bestrophin family ion channel [Chryseobacterium sp. CY353]MCY0968055.1 bestrophin family ion channel [Chryseobacterium sp. CY353]
MHSGKSYKISEFLLWTRRNIYITLIISIVPVLLYQLAGFTWIAIPWTVVSLLGTATAFIVGFKNTQTYNRTWEARQIWGAILNSSRTFGTMSRDFIDNSDVTKELVYRHFAWLTALRYAMRDSRAWETSSKTYNKEYQAFYDIPEREKSIESELEKYISPDELKYILSTKNKAAQLLSLQSKTIKEIFVNKDIDSHQFVEMHRMVKEFYDHQGKSERIKNFPYPRQFASINSFFIKLFCILLPFGMLNEFDKLNDSIEGIMKGQMVWLVIPFSVLISWVYTSLEQVGESTENPFEGSANDVPISQMSRTIEIDMREMLGETDLPPALQPKNNIIL